MTFKKFRFNFSFHSSRQISRSYDIDDDLNNFPDHEADETQPDLNAVDDLGLPEKSSLFSSSFALRRLAPLEFQNEPADPNIPTFNSPGASSDAIAGVPVYYSKRRMQDEEEDYQLRPDVLQKRGGSSFGGVYPGSFGFGDFGGDDGPSEIGPGDDEIPESVEGRETHEDPGFGDFGHYDDYSDSGTNTANDYGG